MASGKLSDQRGAERGPALWVALALHVAVGFFPYGASGLVAPPWGLGVLAVVWGALLIALLRWKPAPRWWLLVIPVVAVALWFAMITAGEVWLGWTA